MKPLEAVIIAMEQNGGYATLGQLYQTATKIPGSKWGTNSPFASIRRIVQKHPAFFRIRPGLWALSSKRAKVLELFSEEAKEPQEKVYTHAFYQGLVAEIGNLKGFQTFIPAQDKNKPYTTRKLGDVATLSQFHEFTYRNVLDKAKMIDVAWFNQRKYPHSFFEIEHTTDIYNSLLKFVELQDFRTNFYIVADIQRKNEFQSKVSLAAFTPIRSFVKFMTYEDALHLHEKISAFVLAEQKWLG